MRRIDKIAILVYVLILSLVILMMPPYGDPAIVIWTSKVMFITGFPYDPVCSKNISIGYEMLLCVRTPLYYLLIAVANEFYKIVPMILAFIFVVLQVILARLNGSSLSVFGLMFPPIYLLFSRTYVDTLTVTLMTALLIKLIKVNGKGLNGILLFSIPLLLMLTRESSLVFPLFLIIISFMQPEFKSKNLLIMFFGWITGFISWQAYVNMSGGVFYSDFEPHIPTFREMYQALMTAITPVLPWEITSGDIQAYININPGDLLMFLIFIGVHIVGFMGAAPIVISLIRFKTNKLILAQAFFGLITAAGLLLMKGDIDFFRHLAYLIPVIPLLIETGLRQIAEYSKLAANLIRASYVIMFTLFLARTVRLYTSGYSFDPCQYLLKRPSIASVPYFYETACM